MTAIFTDKVCSKCGHLRLTLYLINNQLICSYCNRWTPERRAIQAEKMRLIMSDPKRREAARNWMTGNDFARGPHQRKEQTETYEEMSQRLERTRNQARDGARKKNRNA